MKYDLATVSGNDALLLAEAEIGAELLVKYSPQPVGRVYAIEQTGAGAASASAITNAYSLPADGLDLVVVCTNGVRSDDPIVLTLDVTDEDDTETTAVATLAPPSHVADQTGNMPIYAAFDLTLDSGASKKIKSIDGIASITNGVVGNKLEIWALPQESSWVPVGCTRGNDLTMPYSESVNIACGFDSARFTKAGRKAIPELSIEAVYSSYFDSLSRIAGQKVSIMLEARREDRIMADRIVIGGFRAEPQTPRGDGNDESVTTATGQYELVCAFS